MDNTSTMMMVIRIITIRGSKVKTIKIENISLQMRDNKHLVKEEVIKAMHFKVSSQSKVKT